MNVHVTPNDRVSSSGFIQLNLDKPFCLSMLDKIFYLQRCGEGREGRNGGREEGRNGGREEGRKEGREEGRKEGREEVKKRETEGEEK